MSGADPNDEFENENEFFVRAHEITNRQVFRRRPKRAADVINTLLARKGYNQVKAGDDLQSDWESILDSSLRGKTRAIRIRAGKLEVLVGSPLINQELTFIKSNLIEKIQKTSIGKRVRDIRFRVGVIQ